MDITVATWNVLADCYGHNHYTKHTHWKFRLPLIEGCLKECCVDLLLLQEVDHFIDFYEPCLNDLGYSSCYIQRPGRKDGCLIAYKSDKFSFAGECQVSLDESIDTDSLYEQQKYQKQNVGLLLKLKNIASGTEIIVATCHIHWDPQLPEVKTAQVLYMLKRLQQFRGADLTVPIIFTGDFNTLPQDPIYSCINQPNNMALLTEMLATFRKGGGSVDGVGGVGVDQAATAAGLPLRSVFQLAALQQRRQQEGGLSENVSDTVGADVEPALTNWNGDFRATLDYIFVSEHWDVRQPTRVFPTLKANYPDTATLPETDTFLRHELNTPQPSIIWPSDHFIVFASLVARHPNV